MMGNRKSVPYFFLPLVLTVIFGVANRGGMDTAWFFLWVLAFGCWVITTNERWWS